MRLEEIFPFSLSEGLKGLEVKGICDDSRLLRPGELFFIREGEGFDVFSVLKDIAHKPQAFVADRKDREKVFFYLKDKPVIFVDNLWETFQKAVDRNNNLLQGLTSLFQD